jgi:hypothetical protein
MDKCAALLFASYATVPIKVTIAHINVQLSYENVIYID